VFTVSIIHQLINNIYEAKSIHGNNFTSRDYSILHIKVRRYIFFFFFLHLFSLHLMGGRTFAVCRNTQYQPPSPLLLELFHQCHYIIEDARRRRHCLTQRRYDQVLEVIQETLGHFEDHFDLVDLTYTFYNLIYNERERFESEIDHNSLPANNRQ